MVHELQLVDPVEERHALELVEGGEQAEDGERALVHAHDQLVH